MTDPDPIPDPIKMAERVRYICGAGAVACALACVGSLAVEQWDIATLFLVLAVALWIVA